MATKGQKFKTFTNEERTEIVSKYMSGKLTKEDWKERYEILKKYQAFLKAQREKK